jgi:hypothetical protein
MSDPIGAIRALLAADAVVAAMAGADVFGGELPTEAVARLPKGMVLVQASGGPSLTGETYAEHDTQRIDITCYGKTAREAEVLRQNCALTLRRVRRQTIAATLLHWIAPAGGVLPGRERDGGWPFAMQSFQVFHALEEV